MTSIIIEFVIVALTVFSLTFSGTAWNGEEQLNNAMTTMDNMKEVITELQADRTQLITAINNKNLTIIQQTSELANNEITIADLNEQNNLLATQATTLSTQLNTLQTNYNNLQTYYNNVWNDYLLMTYERDSFQQKLGEVANLATADTVREMITMHWGEILVAINNYGFDATWDPSSIKITLDGPGEPLSALSATVEFVLITIVGMNTVIEFDLEQLSRGGQTISVSNVEVTVNADREYSIIFR